MPLLKSFYRPDIANLLICGHWGNTSVFKADSSIITYSLLCGYSPFRSEDRDELIEETVRARVVCFSSSVVFPLTNRSFTRDTGKISAKMVLRYIP